MDDLEVVTPVKEFDEEEDDEKAPSLKEVSAYKKDYTKSLEALVDLASKNAGAPSPVEEEEDDDDDEEDEDLEDTEDDDDADEAFCIASIYGDNKYFTFYDPWSPIIARSINIRGLRKASFINSTDVIDFQENIRSIIWSAMVILSGPILVVEHGDEAFLTYFIKKLKSCDEKRLFIFPNYTEDGKFINFFVYYIDESGYEAINTILDHVKKTEQEMDFYYTILKMVVDSRFNPWSNVDQYPRLIKEHKSSEEDIEYLYEMLEALEDTSIVDFSETNGVVDEFLEWCMGPIEDLMNHKEDANLDSLFYYYRILKRIFEDDTDPYTQIDANGNALGLVIPDDFLHPRKTVAVPADVEILDETEESVDQMIREIAKAPEVIPPVQVPPVQTPPPAPVDEKVVIEKAYSNETAQEFAHYNNSVKAVGQSQIIINREPPKEEKKEEQKPSDGIKRFGQSGQKPTGQMIIRR